MRNCGFFLKQQNQNEIKDKVQSSISSLKKRDNERENEVIINYCSPFEHIPNSYGDRFIPRRYALEDKLERIHLLKYKKANKNNVDFNKVRRTEGFWRWNNFIKETNNIFNIQNKRILQFNDSVVQTSNYKINKLLPMLKTIELAYKNVEGFDWSCKPRPYPLSLVHSTHDLPLYYANTEKIIFKWSSKNRLVAVYKNSLVFWDPSGDKAMRYTIKNVKAIEFNSSGDILAIVRIKKRQRYVIQFWDVTSDGSIHLCKYYYPELRLKQIKGNIRMSWDNQDNYLICGFEDGIIQLIDTDKLELIKNVIRHDCVINQIKCSPNMKYVSISNVEGWIYIFNWPQFHFLYEMKICKKGILMEFHPWNDNDLIIIESFPAAISVINVQSKYIAGYYRCNNNKIRFYSATINKITAELFVSCRIKECNGLYSYEILVLASLNHIVDVLSHHSNKVPYLLWSPNNLQLATIGNDNLLNIWNVFLMNNEKFVEYKIKNVKINNEIKKDEKSFTLFKRFGIR